jgi:4-amino-4-deoxy-L-arabinose transferase-like glycosyltransferase
MTSLDQKSAITARTGMALLTCIIVGAIVLRILAILVLQNPVDKGDSLAYFTMAKSLVEDGRMFDQYGNRAFFSAGYPLLLAPFFALFGSSVPVALAVNMLLSAISIWLIYRFTLILSTRREAGILAATIFALWFVGVWNTSTLAKENLATPLLLGLALCAITIARGHRARSVALIAGLLWGASLITGGSALLLCLGVGVALILLWRREGRLVPALKSGLCFMLGAAVLLTPWLSATNAMVGRPVLTTNAPFNLYIGNNPAATGKFVSIADTPLGKGWAAARRELGEVGNTDRLQREALDWMAENPGRVAELTVLKLAYFWEPNIPDAADFASSKVIASIRVFEVLQYLFIVVFGFLAFRSRQITSDGKWIIAAMIVGFWLIHAIIYIIMRYRDPMMPLLIAMVSVPVADWLRRFFEKQLADGE